MLFNLPFDLKLPKENEIRSDVSRKPILISILENPQNNFCNCTHILLLRSTNNSEELWKKGIFFTQSQSSEIVEKTESEL